jgi:hypothetical protein
MTLPIPFNFAGGGAAAGIVNDYSLQGEECGAGQASHARLLCTSAPNLVAANSCTIEGWAKRKVELNATHILASIFAKWMGNNIAYYLAFFWDGSQTVIRTLISQTTTASIIDAAHWSSGIPAVDTWAHYALTIDTGNASATTFELWINGTSKGNGTLQASDNCSSFNPNTADYLTVGQVPNQLEREKQVDEIRFWKDTVRTDGQISANYQTRLAGSESGLELVDAYENAFSDRTSNGYDFAHHGLGASASSFVAGGSY